MKIIVGLGNPGPKYELTRHNIGFLAVDRLIDSMQARAAGKKHQAEVYQVENNLLLVKPQTFMNLSGRALAPLYSFYQCAPEDLIVIHDDLDLESMSLRIKTGGGSGGHNGLKSIDECLGKAQAGYHRIRLGIGHPSRPQALQQQAGILRSLTQGDRRSILSPQAEHRRISPADYVLERFTEEELDRLDVLLESVVEVVGLILQGKIKIAMNQYHHRMKQEK